MKARSVVAGYFFLLVSSVYSAQEQQSVESILTRDTSPAGVVFEIVGGDSQSLYAALKRAQHYVQKVKQRFPEMKFVILTHGLEQFSLLKENAVQHPQLHQQVQRLVKDDKIPIQVCGAFADMMDVDSKTFSEHVQVVQAAPLALEDYVDKGYVVIEMDLGRE